LVFKSGGWLLAALLALGGFAAAVGSGFAVHMAIIGVAALVMSSRR
jgi:hypothetical protein